ncbi:ArnT family glycosyltransferase [Legionella dresdenensis]|uniref:ArnT family glycosyltransferase n=1 Tax=Legionella dresdenensis TaxID=450200 RepID=A0ABV8CCW4_9GAMM
MILSRYNSLFALALLSLLLFMPGIAKLPVIDRDEAHFAQATRQMLQSGNYFQIRFQEKTRFQKPPGINWLQAGSVKLFSDADSTDIWPYRVPSTLGALLAVIFTWWFSKRFISSKAAITAAVMLAACLLLVIEAHMAVIDASLLFSVLLMQGSLWIVYQASMEGRKAHWGWAFAFWLAMSYGFLLKGVTPLVGLLTIAALCGSERSFKWVSGLRPLGGVALFAGINMLWLALVNHAEHSNYLLQMINKDLLPKLQGGHESHGKPPLFHLFILPLTFWPASLFLWPAAEYAWKNRNLAVVRFLLAWLIPTWLFFECMPTKLPQYILPLLPALAILSALAVQDGAKPGRFLHFLQILWGILSIGLAAAIVTSFYQMTGTLDWASRGLLAAAVILTVLTVKQAWKGQYNQAFKLSTALGIIVFAITFNQLLPAMKPVWLTRNVAELVKNHNNQLLTVVGFEEPSLVFNLNTEQVRFTDADNAYKALSGGNALGLFDANSFESARQRYPSLNVVAKTRGFNYSKGRWVDLLLVNSQV